jgi:hypothetical protein
MRHMLLCPHPCSGNFPSINRCHALGKYLFLLCLTVADRIYFVLFRHSGGQFLACGLHSQPRRIRQVRSEASAGLLQHRLLARACRIATLPAHAHAAWPTHGRELRSLRRSARACRIARPPSLPPACSGSPSTRADVSPPLRRPRYPAARARTPCHRQIATPAPGERPDCAPTTGQHPRPHSLRAPARSPARPPVTLCPSLPPPCTHSPPPPLSQVSQPGPGLLDPELRRIPQSPSPPVQSPTLPIPQPFLIPVCG